MRGLRRSKPAAGGSATHHTPIAKSHRVCGLSASLIKPTLWVLTTWNTILLVLAIIVVAAPGNGPENYTFEKIYFGYGTYAWMAFLWCTIPTLAIILSVIDLLRLKTLNARRAVFSTASSTTLYVVAFALWGTCSFWGQGDVCWSGGWTWYRKHNDPEILRYFMPGFAIGSAVVYCVLMVVAIVTFRRQRSATAEGAYNESLIEKQKMSFDSSEYGISSVGSQTLPSKPRSTVPSRQLSQMTRSERPPTYYSTGDSSLLTVDEKEEKKRGSFGYF